MRRFGYVCAALALLLGVVGARPAQARETVLCFNNVPGIGSCISDRFLDYWRENGGLPVFGYPLTPMFEQVTPEGRFQVQYFERQRFEWHPDQPAPFDVLLGRLGDEQLRKQGRVWQSEPVPSTVPPRCQRFPITDHVVCPSFLTYWNDHGLVMLGHTRFERSLFLFGLPLTETRLERNPDGFEVETQWYERARFEYHPQNPPAARVLLGRLGAEALNGVAASIGGTRDSHDAAQRIVVIGSERDGSTTTVRYTDQTVFGCSDNGAVPPNILDRPQLRIIAEGVFDSRGVMTATAFTILCR